MSITLIPESVIRTWDRDARNWQYRLHASCWHESRTNTPRWKLTVILSTTSLEWSIEAEGKYITWNSHSNLSALWRKDTDLLTAAIDFELRRNWWFVQIRMRSKVNVNGSLACCIRTTWNASWDRSDRRSPKFRKNRISGIYVRHVFSSPTHMQGVPRKLPTHWESCGLTINEPKINAK